MKDVLQDVVVFALVMFFTGAAVIHEKAVACAASKAAQARVSTAK